MYVLSDTHRAMAMQGHAMLGWALHPDDALVRDRPRNESSTARCTVDLLDSVGMACPSSLAIDSIRLGRRRVEEFVYSRLQPFQPPVEMVREYGEIGVWCVVAEGVELYVIL